MDVRLALTERQWRLVEPILPGQPGKPGDNGRNNRMALEGMIWICRTGSPWRDLPKVFGNWNTLHKRFRRWVMSGVFDRIFDALDDKDLQTVMVDATFAKVHQHGTGAKKAVARLRNRLSSKALAEAKAGLRQSLWRWLTKRDDWSGLR